MAVEQVDVIVVGTGWNGLIAAKTYLEFKPEANLVLLEEQASIGGIWSAEKIYPTLFAQIKHGQFEYSFYPMRKEGISRDGYISGETIHTYLNDFARDFGLVERTRLHNKVVKVDRLPGNGWRLEIADKPSIECAKLIYATGATSHPVIPSWPTSNFNTPTIHSSDIGVHLGDIDNIQRATVVGAAKSAYDTVFFLLNSGKQVNWIIREDGTGPLAIVPPTMFGFNTMEIVATRMITLFGSSIMNTEGLGYKFFQKTRLGRSISRTVWKGITKISEAHAGYSKSPNAQKLRPLPHGSGVFWANAGLGAASVPDFWKVFHAGDCTVHRTEIASLSDENIVTLKNGASFETDYLILCTGFDKSYQPFSEELQQACGLTPDPLEADKWTKLEAQAESRVDELLPAIAKSPLPVRDDLARDQTSASGQKLLHGPSRHYRRLVAPSLVAQGDRSIYFPGFIHTIYTPLVSEAQALWGVTFLLGLHDVPSQEVMEKEVAEWNVWTRKRYLAQGRKHAYAIYDFLSYVDMLIRDLGISMKRKRNPLADLFLPTYPRHYRGLVDEFRCAHAKKQAQKTQAVKVAG
ncbi:cofactor FMO1 FAD enzyme [Whalleya microplaca]|nr:cofactor FMO1 FAD enzyme [Whalleya microplaca]